jgi:nucleotide-binding universal stress UspA family protein
MALKDILVHVDNTRACGTRIGAAVELARRHGAHLTGLYTVPILPVPLYAEVQIGLEVLQVQHDAAWSRARAAEKRFREASDRAGLSGEWRVEEGEAASILGLHARYVDLVVIGQVDRDDPEWVDARLPDKVVLESGRPVLIIPYIGVSQPIGKHVMVAWNATREAVRATNDALGFMARAEKVEVLTINPPADDVGDGEIPGADICLHLARHGINAEAQSMQAEDIQVGDLLLSRVSDESVDLLVMGAYGHSRLREIVLSGVTRHLLHHMTVPVLMSH